MRGCVSLHVRPGVKANGSPVHIQVTSGLKGLSSYPRLTVAHSHCLQSSVLAHRREAPNISVICADTQGDLKTCIVL